VRRDFAGKKNLTQKHLFSLFFYPSTNHIKFFVPLPVVTRDKRKDDDDDDDDADRDVFSSISFIRVASQRQQE